MTTSRDDTEEEKGRERVSTKGTAKRGKGIYLMPLLVSIPFLAGMAFALIRYWPTAHKLISILIKLAVRA